MDITKSVLGALGAIVVGVAGWSFDTTRSLSTQTEQIETLEANVKILSSQYSEFNNNLMDLIHRQDKRITVLEYILVRDSTYLTSNVNKEK